MCPVVEALDARRLFAVVTYFMQSTGKFFVGGTPDADNITVSVDASSVWGGKTRIIVADTNNIVYDEQLDGVTNVYVYAKAGDDTVAVGTVRFDGNTLVSTSTGNDTLNDTSFLSPGHAIYTGGGDDQLTISQSAGDLGAYASTGGGNDTVTVNYSALYGGAGDTVVAGAGDDTVTFQYTGTAFGDLRAQMAVYGQDGNDTLVGSDLDEYLSGGAGNDSITAAGGTDFLRGGTGDDTLVSAGDGIDRVERGGGADVLDVDPIDQVL